MIKHSVQSLEYPVMSLHTTLNQLLLKVLSCSSSFGPVLDVMSPPKCTEHFLVHLHARHSGIIVQASGIFAVSNILAKNLERKLQQSLFEIVSVECFRGLMTWESTRNSENQEKLIYMVKSICMHILGVLQKAKYVNLNWFKR